MRTLMIKDLSVNLELDRQAMSAVRGGLTGPASAPAQPAPTVDYSVPVQNHLELDRQAMSTVRGGLTGPASVWSTDYSYYPSWLVYGYPGLG
jgi:hypothetical protein